MCVFSYHYSTDDPLPPPPPPASCTVCQRSRTTITYVVTSSLPKLPIIIRAFIPCSPIGVDLSVYRAAIGIIYLTTHRTVNQPNTFLNLNFQLYCTLTAYALLFARCFIKNDSFTAYRLILLLICMDVHPNPGLASSDSNGTSLDIFHLNARSIRNKLQYIYSIAEEYHILCFLKPIWIKA